MDRQLILEALSRIQIPSASGAQLVEVLRKQAALEAFAGATQYVLVLARSLSYEDLALWLVNRQADVGSDRALDDLERFLTTTEELPLLQVAPLAGVEVRERHALTPELALVPIEDLPRSVSTARFAKRAAARWPWMRISCALVHYSTIAKEDYLLPGSVFRAETNTHALDRLDETTKLLALVTRRVTACVAYWVQIDEWVPCGNLDATYSFFMEAPVATKTLLGPSRCKLARALTESWSNRTEDCKRSIRIALERLNSAMGRRSRLDSVIDLTIAFEALFLNDATQRPVNRRSGRRTLIQRRAGNLLRARTATQSKVNKLIDRVYELRNQAVHTGRLDCEAESLEQTLIQGYRLAARCLRTVIRQVI